MINAGDSNILQTNYFNMKSSKKERRKRSLDINELVDEIFDRKWQGKDKWIKFTKTYAANGSRKEILQKCVHRLKNNGHNGNIRYHDIATLFGITANNMRQQFHTLKIDWKELKKTS